MNINATNEIEQIVVFKLDEQRYALRLSAVERIVQAVEITPLPKAPAIVLGVINVGGKIIPVVNIRKRLNFKEREIQLNDQFIIAKTLKRNIVLSVDEVTGLIECPDQGIILPDNVLPNLKYVDGIIKLSDGLVLIHDLDKFLSLEEEELLNNSL
ncbi:MAG: chemotaxis protein CheW [Ignavibacteriaceae bacterium]